MRDVVTAVIILSLVLEVCSDWSSLLQGFGGKRPKINDDQLNEAIKTQLDEYFSTVDPIDVKYNIPGKEVTDMKAAYDNADQDRNGQLTLKEMRGLVNVKNAMTEAELRELLRNADTNGNNQLSMEELAAYIAHTELDESKVDADFNRDQFKLMDLNRDKKIDMNEFQRLYRFCNQNFNRQLIDKIVKVADQDKDKRINYEELTVLLKSNKVVKGGSKRRPSELALARIKHCIKKFISKCKGGFCNRPMVNRDSLTLTELVTHPFTIQ